MIKKPMMNLSRLEWVAEPDNKFWVAVQTPKEGYIVVHSDLEEVGILVQNQ